MYDNLSIYIHWPFCLSKCNYCDFNSYATTDINEQLWKNAYLRELNFYKAGVEKKIIKSIYFGGGTPSMMAPSMLDELLDFIYNNYPVDKSVEITLEANPNTAATMNFSDLKELGINRLSIGVQSFSEENLHFLGRTHSKSEAIDALRAAAKFFDRYSFDLIYALPNQDVLLWQKELSEALDYAGGHLSLYQLSVEPNTVFFKQGVKEANDELAAELFDFTNDFMAKNNLPAYEISNYATCGQESVHNLTYWNYGEWVGIGPGAHGRLKSGDCCHAVANFKLPKVWLEKVHGDGWGAETNEVLTNQDIEKERIMMGLRLSSGLKKEFFANVEWNKIITMMDNGFLIVKDDNIKTTSKGRRCLNAVLDYIL